MAFSGKAHVIYLLSGPHSTGPAEKDCFTEKPSPNPCLIRFAKKGEMERRKKRKEKGRKGMRKAVREIRADKKNRSSLERFKCRGL